MRIEGRAYDDEEWRIVRIPGSPAATGRNHHQETNHHGEMRGGAYACEDCRTVYYDAACIVLEDPGLRIDGEFMSRLVDLAVEHGRDLVELQRFIEEVARKRCPGYAVPDLVLLRALEGGGE